MNTSSNAPLRSSGRRAAAVLGGLLVAVAVISGCGSSGGTAASSTTTIDKATTVTTKLLSFMPGTLTVKAGTKVIWTAGDGIGHTVTTGTFTLGSDGLRTTEHSDGRIDMPLRQGTDVSYTFTTPGKYVYYCSIHHGMNGEIVVTP